VDYPFIQTLEDNWRSVLEELDNLLYNEAANEQSYFEPWPETDIYSGDWDVFGLYYMGQKLEKNCEFCPKTTALIESIPGVTTAGFSALAPETEIAPHVGYTDAVLRCHLGLIVPQPVEGHDSLLPTCALQVENKIYTWTPGRAFVFDDTKLHSAWNYGDRTRFVLLLDFLKGGTTP
jgi:ornithine lipid ester-linked acyl 2-hydroxylase